MERTDAMCFLLWWLNKDDIINQVLPIIYLESYNEEDNWLRFLNIYIPDKVKLEGTILEKEQRRNMTVGS